MPGLLDSLPSIQPTPRQNKVLGLLSDALYKADAFARKPFGYDNPPVQMALDAVGAPGLLRTIDRLSYGEPLTTGKGQTTRLRDDTVDALGFVPLSPRTAAAVVSGGLGHAAGHGYDGAMMMYHGSKQPITGGYLDLSRVGSNTGANTEGWGIYLSEALKNAKVFGRNITKLDVPDDVVASKFLDWAAPVDQQPEAVRRLAGLYANAHNDPREAYQRLQAAIKNMGRLNWDGGGLRAIRDAATYQANDAAHLDLAKVKAITEANPSAKRLFEQYVGRDPKNGQDVFRAMVNFYAGSQKAAAGVMRDAGIPGMKMPAAHDMHSAVFDVNNFVIHDQDFLRDFAVPKKAVARGD